MAPNYGKPHAMAPWGPSPPRRSSAPLPTHGPSLRRPSPRSRRSRVGDGDPHPQKQPRRRIATISTLTRRRWGFIARVFSRRCPRGPAAPADQHRAASAPRGPAPRRFSTAQYNRVGILHTAHITNSFYWTPSPPPRSALGSARRPRRVRPTQLNTLASPALDPRLHSPQSRRKWQL